MNLFRMEILGEAGTKGEIAWPIARTTERAVQVQTAGGLLWLPAWQFRGQMFYVAPRWWNWAMAAIAASLLGWQYVVLARRAFISS
jgi:hypothetical protein